jgi:hypothetical protein
MELKYKLDIENIRLKLAKSQNEPRADDEGCRRPGGKLILKTCL